MISRETIYAALFARVANAADFVTTSRRMRQWSALTPAEQPALYMRQKTEIASVRTLGAPTVWTLQVDMCIYVHTSDPYLAPAAVLNPLIDAIEATLAPPPASGMQDLGLPDMVRHVVITGKVEINGGVQRNQAAAVIPVDILCL